jgi:segregation and condensation protein A
MTYKVDLDIYNGPMDLLLYLVRREEMDIREIPIARIADQYIAYLAALEKLDIELAGDFIVMAATLLELKSRALLPRAPEIEEDEPEGEDEEDPRETLIRQLIDYRRFKEAAAMLNDRGHDMARRWPRQVDDRLLEQAGALDAEEVGPPVELFQGIEIWDLIGAFSVVVKNLGYTQAREVVYDDTPIEQVGVRIVERLQAEKSLLFTQLFAQGRTIVYCISVFMAILELIRQRKVGIEQPTDFKDIRVFLRDPATEPPPEAITPRGADESADALQRKHPRRPSSRQNEGLQEMLEDVDFEKTEFDEILESIQVPEVEAFHPIYSDDELMGRTAPAAGASAGESKSPDASASGSTGGEQPQDAGKPPALPGDGPGAGSAGGNDEGRSENPPAGRAGDESMSKDE